jgi:Tfp pilus assembly ATPase PilU
VSEREAEKMASTLEKLETIARLTNQEVTHLLARAIELGIEQLWVQTIVDLYLKGQISRKEAIQAVGLRWVERAEQIRDAILEDVRWGLGL